MTRILHIFKDYYPPTHGGIEQHINDIVHGVHGFEFEVLTASRTRHRVIGDDHGIVVNRAPEWGRVLSNPLAPTWVADIAEIRPDIIHVHMPNPVAEISVLASLSKARVVATWHANVPRPVAAKLYSPFQAAFLKRASVVITSSPPMAARVPVPHGKVRVVSFGVDPEVFRARPARSDEIRSQVDGPLVVFLGRLVHYKGLDVLLEAMRDVDATLAVVGDGPLRAQLETSASTDVRFVGAVSDDERTAWLHAADVCVLPSTSAAETFGISMLEAMACGTPVVSTEVGTGTSWVNLHGNTGLVVPPGRADLLAGALREVLGDPEATAFMGQAARQRVIDQFTRDAMLAGIRDVYEMMSK